MRIKLCIVLLIFLMIFTIGCESKSVSVEPVAEKSTESVKPITPFDDRLFIYTNGITITTKEATTKDEKGIKVVTNYPVISGLKNKKVQDKLNKEFTDVGEKQLEKLEIELPLKYKDKDLKANQKISSAYIAYNCNNVIFVDYNANIDSNIKGDTYYPMYNYTSYGYDLNTGERIGLKDLFKPGTDYNSKINNYICQYLIENNYDDYAFERMTKPFQGIKENQSFTFGVDGIRIILDESNDEFVDYGYPEQILIPIREIADDIYIFDRYFDEGKSIFEKDKLTKKLLTSKIEFKVDKLIQEQKDKYFIYIPIGKFINVPNKEIESKLNAMAVCNFDTEDFKKKAEEKTPTNRFSNYSFNVNVFMNAGGYFSMATMESMYLKDHIEIWETKPFNYDFNLNKEMSLSDIFENMTEVEKAVKERSRQMHYSVSDEALDACIKKALKSDKFFFEEYGVNIYLPIEGDKLEEGQKWIWISFQEMNPDNIKLFK